MTGLHNVDIFCDGNNRIGFGHIRRSLTLASQLEREGINVRLFGLSEASQTIFPTKHSNLFKPSLTIFDTPLNIDAEIKDLSKRGQLSIALDYFGSTPPDVNIVVYPHKEVFSAKAAHVGFQYILIRDEIALLQRTQPSGAATRVIVMVGGGDILGHGHIAARTLAAVGCDVVLVEGPFSGAQKQPQGYRVYKNPPDLPELFAGCDWAVTSGGGSLFEGLCLGKAVHVLPQTEAETRIAEYVALHNGLLGIGLDSLRAYSPSELAEVASNEVRLVDGLGAHRVSKIVRSWL